MSSKRARTLTDDEEAQRRRCAIAAQRLEHSYNMYRPGVGMFAAACKCWRYINVGDDWQDRSCVAGWHVFREEGRLLIPRFDPADKLIDTEFEYTMEQCLALVHLKVIVKRLDNDDMTAFFQHLVIVEKKHFDALFTSDFVGDDARLAYIRDFVESAKHDKEQFFNGPEQADKTKVFGAPA